MTYLIFKLSMPSRNSWNGKWSGEESVYALKKSFPDTMKGKVRVHGILDKMSFHHSFGDGWVARVDVQRATSKEARDIMKKSLGFKGYDWMVDSIIANGKIQ